MLVENGAIHACELPPRKPLERGVLYIAFDIKKAFNHWGTPARIGPYRMRSQSLKFRLKLNIAPARSRMFRETGPTAGGLI